MNDETIKVGDILRVSCTFAPTRVVKVSDWDVMSLFQTDPAPWTLSTGDNCGVGIPEQLVRVIDIGYCDPPQDVGWLPRPHTMLIVLPVDYEDPHGLAEGDTISMPSVAPVTFELV